ncbi:zinc finger protein 865 isoform X4 [Cardiocondyla obscurior]|uniref:zinc finger protein 865 isoform X4 n=1 Tax=Cardiocondyla obscurior TaxID=286306 RepID=UPI00396567A8
MEGNGTRMDYEDMFREITKKLYGEDPDHKTSSVQNEFETSYKNDEDTGNGTDGSDDGNWTYEDEPLKGTDGSRIAAYHAGKAMWRCDECGDIMSNGPREIAEHFMEYHPSRILADSSRNRHHSPRKDYLQSDFKIEDLVMYLERLRERAERAAPPSRRTQETQTVPAALLPVTSSFLLQELPSAPAPQHLQYYTLSQNATPISSPVAASTSGKRYTCPCCPYGTDRRDLYTRHENIHREEKPFHCYMCYKPFNRADHVKKHFLRMHRDHTYEVARIRRPVGTTAPKPLQQDTSAATATVNVGNQQQPQQQQQQQQQHMSNQFGFVSNKGYQLQPNAATSSTSTGTGTTGLHQAIIMPSPTGIVQSDANNCNTGRRVQNGGCNSKSHLKGGSKSTQERRYTCLYCPWSGVDNWCLKRHLNTHTKPFACTLCEYKAARAERLATHVLKVHNRRQCSRCSFLGEDANQLQMHQVHVHRASVPSTSTAQNAPLSSNRHQQPLHPVGGGRPPPGPPVFPAPAAPTIAPATTVIPPSTILGYQISSILQAVDRLSRLPLPSQKSESRPHGKENHLKMKRSRKQSQPRQVIWYPNHRKRYLIRHLILQNVRNQKVQIDSKSVQSQQRSAPTRMFKCHLCPKYAPARGKTHRPYHSKASLTLHMLWRHKRRSWPAKKQRRNDSIHQVVSSVTLKATVFANPNYRYDR